MKKFTLSVACILAFIFLGAQASFATSVAFKEGKVFIADGGLVVRDLDQLDVTEICVPGADPEVLSTATDVEIISVAGAYSALVTVHPIVDDTTDPVTTVADFVVVGIADACFPEVVVDPSEDVVVDDCYAYLDGDTLHIPCILLGDDVISAVMTQNGGSQNWKAHGAFKNETVSGHHHRHKGKHDDDDDD